MVHMTDSANVDVRLVPLKLLAGHFVKESGLIEEKVGF